MADFPSAVSAPGGMSYAAPLMNFAQFGNWAADDPYQKIFNEQQQKLNAQRIQQGQTAIDISQAFQGGLPRDAQGNIDYRTAVAMLAKKGDVGALWNGADAMLAQSATQMSPLLTGGAQPQGQPQAPGGQGGAPGPAPTSVPAPPLSAPNPNSPKGDSGSGTIAALVTDRMPNQDATTGQTIAKIAQTVGVDPNAPLTPGQTRRVQGLLDRYAPTSSASKDAGGTLPPSANAGSPRPPVASDATPAATVASRFPSTPAPIGAPAQPAGPGAGGPPVAPGQPQQPAQVQPQPPVQPQQHPNTPITPQVPLPKGFTDPQTAILALRTEAARLSSNPRAKGQAEELQNWASRIEESLKPVAVNPNTTLLDPRTGQPIYQGGQPTMSGDAINAAAERYLQTGQLPPNMGRGAQGTADRNAILTASSDLAQARGINPADLPSQWQQFKARQVGIQRFTSGPQGNTVRSFNVLVDHLDTLDQAAAALKNGDIRAFNSWKQNWAKATGNEAPTSFDGVKALVGDEIVKAVVGSAGALADREEVKKDLDKASSPKQLADLVDKYKKLALGQLHGLQKQYEASTGLKNFNDMLLPGTLAALGGNRGKGSDPDKDGWVTLPNGSRIREIKAEGK